jgi:hypothetical protein
VAHGIERYFHARNSEEQGSGIKAKTISRPAKRWAAELKFRFPAGPGKKSGGLDGEDLATFVVAAGGAGDVARHRAAALAAFIQFRRVPAVAGFAGAQPHFRGFAFWNSHGFKSF